MPPAPVGVGGWLLFFVLQLFLLNPAVVGRQALGELGAVLENGTLHTPLGLVIAIESAVRLLIVAAGMACGVLLCTRHPRAVRAARSFLIAAAVAHLALMGLPFTVALPAPVQMRIAGVYLYRGAMTLPATIFWFLYFRHSRRVKATYGSTPGHEPV